MRNKIILLAVLAMLSLGIDAQTVTHSFRNTSMSDALRYLSTATRHYIINFAYNDLEDFKITADVRNQRASGKSVMFDLQNANGATFNVNGEAPTMLYLMNT